LELPRVRIAELTRQLPAFKRAESTISDAL